MFAQYFIETMITHEFINHDRLLKIPCVQVKPPNVRVCLPYSHGIIAHAWIEKSHHLHLKSTVEAFNQPLLLATLQGQRMSDNISVVFTTHSAPSIQN